MQFIVEFFGKPEGNRTHPDQVVRRGIQPPRGVFMFPDIGIRLHLIKVLRNRATADICFTRGDEMVGDREHADLFRSRIFRRENRQLCRGGVQGKFHIGLTGRQPHFPDQNIFHFRTVAGAGIADLQCKRSARFHGGHPQQKRTVTACHPEKISAVKGHFHNGFRIRLTENRNESPPLKNGAV